MKYERASLAILFTFVFTFLYVGCDRPYLPWVQSPWQLSNERGHSSSSSEPQSESVSQGSIEDFCTDMRDTIVDYRLYINDESVSVSRRNNIKRLVEEYDRQCSEAE